jgi:hypothetical protein
VRPVLIALLAVLGVNLIVLAVFAAGVVTRRRWISHQDGAFAGIAHLVKGEAHPLGTRPRRGYGRWVRDVLVWTPAPFYLRNTFAPIDRVEGTRQAAGKIRRLGDSPRVLTLVSGAATIEVTVRDDSQSLVTAPFGPVDATDGASHTGEAGFDGSIRRSS